MKIKEWWHDSRLRRYWQRLIDPIENTYYGIRNVIRWAPIIWRDADFDWDFLARIMEYKLRRMSAHHQKARIVVGYARISRQTLVCAELLRRLQEDDYFRNAGYDAHLKDYSPNPNSRWHSLPSHEKTRIAKHAQQVARNDLHYLGVLIGKYLTHWWD